MTWLQLLILCGVFVLLILRLIRRKRAWRLRLRSEAEQARFRPVGTTYNPRPFRRPRSPRR